MNKSRVEAITDGIIAIAATIMVLELAIPATQDWNGLIELRHTFIAYVNSFALIYIVWSMHHDLFQKAEVISKRAFLVNGVWIFVLTLIPFTNSWVGKMSDAFLPEFFYPLNLLLLGFAFQWLTYRIRKDNPHLPAGNNTRVLPKAIMYGGYGLALILSFIRPSVCIYIVGFTTALLIACIFAAAKKQETPSTTRLHPGKQ